MIKYNTKAFYRVLLQYHGSVVRPNVLLRAGLAALAATVVAILHHRGLLASIGLEEQMFTSYLGPLISLLIAFRISSAFSLWSDGVAATGHMANSARVIVTSFTAYLDRDGPFQHTGHRVHSISVSPRAAVDPIADEVADDGAAAVSPAAASARPPGIAAALFAPHERTGVRATREAVQAMEWRRQSDEAILCVRRHVVLMVVMVMKHLQGEKHINDVIQHGILTAQEAEELSRHRVATHDGRTYHKHGVPVKARPSFCAQLIRLSVQRAIKEGRLEFWAAQNIDRHISEFINDFATLARIAMTPIPFCYAQLIKILIVFYVLSYPFGVVASLGWATIPSTLIMAIILFGCEELAVEIEGPFGNDANDIDLIQRIRRIDKEAAYLVSARLGVEINPFDAYWKSVRGPHGAANDDDHDRPNRASGWLSSESMTKLGAIADLKQVSSLPESETFAPAAGAHGESAAERASTERTALLQRRAA